MRALFAMLLALAFGLLVLAFFVFRSSFAPEPIRFDAVAVENVTPYTASVVAVVARDPMPKGCTNGIQADMRSGSSVTRLPVPLRTQRGAKSEYALVLPYLTTGRYEVQVRETLLCTERLRVIATPWIRMEVPNARVD